MPIMAVYFNKIAVLSLIVSCIAGIIIGPLIILSFIFIIFHRVLSFIGILRNIISFMTTVIIRIAEFGRNLPLNNFYVVTPSILLILIYYLALMLRIIFLLYI